MKVTLLGMIAILGVTATVVLMFLVTTTPGGGSVCGGELTMLTEYDDQ